MRPVLFIVLFVSCAVDLPDAPGFACDATHPCEAGRDCIDGICRDEGAAGGHATAGGSAGGSAGGVAGGMAGGRAGGGAAGGTAGGSAGGTAGGSAAGGTADAGRVVWRQAVEGFTGQTDPGSATVTIKADAGNQVTSVIVTPDDANDRASANQTDAGLLPQTGNGHLKGKFRLPSALALKGLSTFLRLEDQGNLVVSLAFDPSGNLIVKSDTGLIGNMTLNQMYSRAGGFSANTDYTVEVLWQRGVYRSLFVNGADAGTLSNFGMPGSAATPDQLRLGIYRYDADAGIDAGWTIILNEWQLADEPAVPL